MYILDKNKNNWQVVGYEGRIMVKFDFLEK